MFTMHHRLLHKTSDPNPSSFATCSQSYSLRDVSFDVGIDKDQKGNLKLPALLLNWLGVIQTQIGDTVRWGAMRSFISSLSTLNINFLSCELSTPSKPLVNLIHFQSVVLASNHPGSHLSTFSLAMMVWKCMLFSLLAVPFRASESVARRSDKVSCDELELSLTKEPCANNAEVGVAGSFSMDDFSTCREALKHLCLSRDAVSPDHHLCQDDYWNWMKQCAIPARFGATCTCGEDLTLGSSPEVATTSRELQMDDNNEATRSLLTSVSSLFESFLAFFGYIPCLLSFGLFFCPPPLSGGSYCSNETDPVTNETYLSCVVDGRPMWDDNNRLVVAPARMCGGESYPSWSSDTRVSTPYAEPLKASHNSTNDRVDKWTRRAVGEHASIASFASFVINLMTHQAPPHLIRSALMAAQDELDHATMSFTVASLLQGSDIEPGPLPLASLSFSRNMTTFGIATASEGCIDETVSALLLADEVATSQRDFDTDDDLETRIVRATGKMANDEGNHSTLAWKTIHWICQSDEKACTAIEKILLGETVASPSVRRAFDGLLAKLIPFVMRGETNFSLNDCDNTGESALPLSQLSADTLAKRIVVQVVCGTITEPTGTKRTAQV